LPKANSFGSVNGHLATLKPGFYGKTTSLYREKPSILLLKQGLWQGILRISPLKTLNSL